MQLSNASDTELSSWSKTSLRARFTTFELKLVLSSELEQSDYWSRERNGAFGGDKSNGGGHYEASERILREIPVVPPVSRRRQFRYALFSGHCG